MQTRGYGPIPTITPMSLAPDTPVTASYAGSTSSQHSLSTAQASLASFNFGTTSTAPSSAAESAPISSKSSALVPAPPAAAPAVPDDQFWDAALAQSQAQLSAESREGPPPPKAKERRISKAKVTRFTELETIDSHVEHTSFEGGLPAAYTIPSAPSAPEAGKTVDNKDVAVRETVQEVNEPTPAASKGRRLSKQPKQPQQPQQPPGGAKPAKKSRWMSRSSSTVAV
jgi:hypothetical protein